MHSPVIGLALDGVGLGSDGASWGGELLRVDGAHFERLAHLPSLLLPGGDVAAREPWRMAAALLHRLGRAEEIAPRLDQAIRSRATPEDAARFSVSAIELVLRRGLNCPATTSAGRWFDAVAGLLGVSLSQDVQAQAALALEQLADEWLANNPAPVLDAELAAAGLNLDCLMLRLLSLCDRGLARSGSLREVQGEAAALFHVALADALARAATEAALREGLRTVALGGGCFLNRVLRNRVTAALTRAGLQVCVPRGMNFGDAGLALGQAWVAAQTVHAERKKIAHKPTRRLTCV
jgi:hydrogenase maturation protein HypF